MNIDTNTVYQAAQAVNAVQTSFNWPAIAAAALWVRADLYKLSEYVISHGGVWMIAKKLWFNPPAK
jgi:hypothetical protein